jgi:hypothetical protein
MLQLYNGETKVAFQRDDGDDVRFDLDQHAEWDFL